MRGYGGDMRVWGYEGGMGVCGVEGGYGSSVQGRLPGKGRRTMGEG